MRRHPMIASLAIGLVCAGSAAAQVGNASVMCVAAMARSAVVHLDYCGERLGAEEAERAARMLRGYEEALRRLYGEQAESHMQNLERTARPSPNDPQPCGPMRLSFVRSFAQQLSGEDGARRERDFFAATERAEDVYRGFCL